FLHRKQQRPLEPRRSTDDLRNIIIEGIRDPEGAEGELWCSTEQLVSREDDGGVARPGSETQVHDAGDTRRVFRFVNRVVVRIKSSLDADRFVEHSNDLLARVQRNKRLQQLRRFGV